MSVIELRCVCGFASLRYVVKCLGAIVFLALTACGGGSAGTAQNASSPDAGLSCPGASQSTGSTVNITGQVTYDRIPPLSSGGLDYSNILVKPARSIKVVALDGGEAQLAATVTDIEGYYSLSVSDKTCIKIRAFAQSIPLTGNQGTWNFKVTDNTSNNALYAMDGELRSSGTGNSVRNLHAPSGWDGQAYGSRVAGPFAIIDTVYTAVTKVLAIYPTLNFPASELRWSINNRPVENGDLQTGEIGTSFYTGSEGNIYLLGAENSDTDEYDEHLILHEWGHYFENAFSRSDSLGGSHSLDERLDLRVAFGEGWANAWSAIAADRSVYSDALGNQQQSGFTFDMESNSPVNRGWFNESSVQSIIYDIYDDTNEAGDNISLSLGPLLDTLTASSYIDFDGVTSLYAFLEVLRQNVPSSVAAINNLVSNQFINGSGFYGSGENNGSGAVPVYTDLSLGGVATVCSDNDHGEYNKLQNRRLLKLSVDNAAIYSVSVSASSAESSSTDPDVNIWLKGQLIAALESGVNNSENGSVSLQRGNYLLELFDFYNVDEDASTGGRSCFNIQVF